MNELTKQELQEVLVDVRKSYRLLYFYQRRIIDTISYIANCFSKHIVSGRSLFSSNPPRNDRSFSLDYWAWDWLNMYDYEFNLGEERINGNQYTFAIAVQADTGFYDIDEKIVETEVEKFAPVEDANSFVYFMLGKNTWKPERYQECWEKAAQSEYFSKDGNFIVKRFCLSDFNSETSVREKLSAFMQFASQNGMAEFVMNKTDILQLPINSQAINH